MGYNTKFSGVLQFLPDVPIGAVKLLHDLIGEPGETITPSGYGAHYIDIVIADDLTGIKWDEECEKTYGMVETVNYLLDKVREQYPEFGLTGSLLARGEDIEDVWNLVIKDGKAVEVRVDLSESLSTCPSCGHQWTE